MPPGHGVDGAVLLKREPGGDEAAAAEGGFHDYDAERKAADDPVADGEMPGVRKRSGRVFRNEQAPLDDRPAQSVIFFGVADIGARAEHGDGPAGRSRAARCACLSMPMARPETTVMPEAARPLAMACAARMPSLLHVRVPTMLTQGFPSRLMSPWQ